MWLSTIVLCVWVFLVSIWARGWAVDFHIIDAVFWVGVAFVIVRVLEAFGKGVSFGKLNRTA